MLGARLTLSIGIRYVDWDVDALGDELLTHLGVRQLGHSRWGSCVCDAAFGLSSSGDGHRRWVWCVCDAAFTAGELAEGDKL
jgi:hypothetical protein